MGTHTMETFGHGVPRGKKPSAVRAALWGVITKQDTRLPATLRGDETKVSMSSWMFNEVCCAVYFILSYCGKVPGLVPICFSVKEK